MSDDTTTPRASKDSTPRRRDHLSVVAEPVTRIGTPPAARPRTIGRLIAQTALIADSAVTRRRSEAPLPDHGRGMAGRLLGRFR